jgi:hypothetical protein
VLAAPVLPTDFNWQQLFAFKQVEAVRYDTAWHDWPVAILCQALRAFGFSDVGPSGVVQFGEGTLAHGKVKQVGWYDGDHGAALKVHNLPYLLAFALDGKELRAGEPLQKDFGPLLFWSRATPHILHVVIILSLGAMVWLFTKRRRIFTGVAATLLGLSFIIYVALDIY